MPYTVYYTNSDTTREVDTLEEARELAEKYVGNSSATRPFPEEGTYLYGPGDGTTSVMVREKFVWTPREG